MDAHGSTARTAPPTSIARNRPFNLVVVTLDTTRADRLGAYGFAEVETPAIDTRAAGGILFRNAYSPVPLTLPAHVSLFTGVYPFAGATAPGSTSDRPTPPRLGVRAAAYVRYTSMS